MIASVIEGGCLCGQVRYQITRSHLSAIHCYCGMCRKAHGGAFSTHAPMRADQFQLTRGELKTAASSEQGVRAFCVDCGSHILVHGQTTDGSVAVPLGTIDGDPEVSVTGHIFVKDKVSWFEIADALPQFVGWPAGVEATHVERLDVPRKDGL